MPRTSPVHYIAPSAISITPNANESAHDVAVYIATGAKIRVFSRSIAALGFTANNTFQEWTIIGRNRRLTSTGNPYTVYARLKKNDKTDGYLVFAPKAWMNNVWKDKYPYVTLDDGLAKDTAGFDTGNYWYIKLGEVSAPVEGERTLTFDTGILGTDQFNTEWNLDPDDMPLRVKLSTTIDGEDGGPTPYVPWGKTLQLAASLVEGWETSASSHLDHWTIERTVENEVDPDWPDASRAAAFSGSGHISLSHIRDGVDDFNSQVSVIFTVTAWGYADDDSSDSSSGTPAIVPLTSANITIMAETVEKYELVLSNGVVSFNPLTGEYSPAKGIAVNIRATDQKTEVYKITKATLDIVQLQAEYSLADAGSWVPMSFASGGDGIAVCTIPISLFQMQQSVNLRLKNSEGKEIDSKTIAFVRGGEDTAEREWIFLRSTSAITFGDAQSSHPLPALISLGEVDPDGAAAGLDANKNQAGWVPQGWYDDMQGTDSENRYEYGAYRDWVDDDSAAGGHWGDFNTPSLWDYHSDDATSYYCQWTLGGEEIWQLPYNKDGKFEGKLPLVATLMKRTANGSQPVTAAATAITVRCDGLQDVFTINTQNPRLVIRETVNPEILPALDSKDLTGLAVTFEPDNDSFAFFVPVSSGAGDISEEVETFGSEFFLRKDQDDTAKGNITFEQNIFVGGDATVSGDAYLNGATRANHIQSTEYTGDGMMDAGYKLWYENGRAKLVIDDLVARGKFSVNELESRIWTYAGGNMIFSGAGSTIFFVEYLNADGEAMGYTYINSPWLLKGRALLAGMIAWSKRKEIKRDLTATEIASITKFRCYEFSDDGTMQTRNWWQQDDLAYCCTLNHVKNKRNSSGQYSGSVSNTVYWRKVVGIGSKTIPILNDGRVYDYVDLSFADHAQGYDDWPAAGDVIVQRGNVSNPSRQCCVTIEVEGDDLHGFNVYDGINSYNAADTKWVSIGYKVDTDEEGHPTGKADMTVYGDAYIGARPESGKEEGSTFLRFERDHDGEGHGLLKIKARIDMHSTLGDDEEETTLQDTLDAINTQIDSKAETWYQNTDPSVDWYDDTQEPVYDVRSEHVGDLWYCTDNILDDEGEPTQFCKDTTWRYSVTGSSSMVVDGETITTYTYGWEQQNVPEAVFDKIDGKAAVYTTWGAWVVDGHNELHVRDLYIPSADHTEGSGQSAYTYKQNKVYRCTNAETPAFEEINYTDDVEVRDFVNLTAQGLQKQIDGQYVSWFGNETPTLSNAPAKDWNSVPKKDEHVDDLYYNKTDGNAYRFTRTVNGDNITYGWTQIGDSSIIAVMAQAAAAQDTADGKRRVFTSQPTTPYDVGDLWAQGSEGDIMRCKTAKTATQSYAAADWEKASKYTDDTAFYDFFTNTYSPFVTNIQGQVDSKAETWYQPSNPETSWTTDAEKDKHVGDLWYCTADIANTNYKKDTTWFYKRSGSAGNYTYAWVQQDVPASVFDKIDGKADIFVGDAPTTYNVNDMWIIGDNVSSANMPTGCQKGDIVISSHKRTNNYTKGDWSKKDRYTDDTTVNTFVNSYGQILQITPTAAGVGQALGYLNKALVGGTTTIDGGLMLTNIIYMKDDATTPKVRAGISGLYKTSETGTGYKGHGTAAWFGGGVNNGMPIDHEVSTSADDYAKILFRFDGSGYLAGGLISWSKSGVLTAANFNNVTTQLGDILVDGVTITAAQLANLKNMLDMFELDTTTQAGTTLIKAKYSLYSVGDVSAMGHSTAGGGGGGGGASVMYELNDVRKNNDTTPTSVYGAAEGNVLTYNGTLGRWEGRTLQLATSLVELTDVTISSVADGQILMYDSSTSKWKNVTRSWLRTDGNNYMTGKLRVATAIGIEDATGNGLLCYKPTTWTGLATRTEGGVTEGTQWGVGTIDVQGVIRSSNSDLLHYRHVGSSGNITSTIIDSTNVGTYAIKVSDTEQTVASTISSMQKGIVEFYRSSGDHYAMIGFANKGGANSTKQILGFIGFRSGAQNLLTFRTAPDSNNQYHDYDIIHSGNISTQSVGHAGTADKLKTTRTLWGVSFDGSANVSGNMTDVGNITMSATDGTYIQIGGARIVWDNTNKALKVIQSDNSTAANFYATGDVSAFGASSSGGGGGGGGASALSDLNDVTISSLANGNILVYDSSTSHWKNVANPKLSLLANQYTDSLSTYALNLNNSNIVGVNSIYTADASDGASEGIHFYRDSTHVDTLWMASGNMYFVPNREIGTNTSASNSNVVLHSGNISSYAITESNIGSQSVSYATSAGSATEAYGIHSASVNNYVGMSYKISAGSAVLDSTTKYEWAVPSKSVDKQWSNAQTLRLMFTANYYTDILTSPNSHGTNTGLFYRQWVSDGYVTPAGSFNGGWRLLIDSCNWSNYIGTSASPVEYSNNSGRLGGWSIGEIQPTGYVVTNTNLGTNHDSYWCCIWDITITDKHQYNFDVTFLLSSTFLDRKGIIQLKLRQNGENDSGAYNFGCYVKQLCGNIPNQNVRLYYNNSTGKCALWINVEGQYGAYNATMLKKNNRGGYELQSCGSLKSTTFTSAQTLPSSSYAQMESDDLYITKSGATDTFVEAKNNKGSIELQVASGGNRGVYNGTGGTGGSWLIATNGTNTWMPIGNVGIGTTTPSYKLHVNGSLYASSGVIDGALVKTSGHLMLMGQSENVSTSGTTQILFGKRTILNDTITDTQHVVISSNKNFIIINPSTSSTNGQIILGVNGGYTSFMSSGKFGIGVTGNDISTKLHVVGDIYATGDVTAASDENLKNVVCKANISVKQIANAPAVKFTWKDGQDKDVHTGSLAQYWQKVLPEAVIDRCGTLSMNYGAASMVAVINVAKKVVSHEEQIKQLKNRISELENEVKQLKSA